MTMDSICVVRDSRKFLFFSLFLHTFFTFSLLPFHCFLSFSPSLSLPSHLPPFPPLFHFFSSSLALPLRPFSHQSLFLAVPPYLSFFLFLSFSLSLSFSSFLFLPLSLPSSLFSPPLSFFLLLLSTFL